jgi:predicted amidohydrolase YtcJ
MDATALKYWDTPLQVHAHAVGDQAVDNFVSAFEKAGKIKGHPAVVGPVLQHAALVRPDQVRVDGSTLPLPGCAAAGNA